MRTRGADHSGRRELSFAERISHLNQKRQEIMRPVHEHPREYVLLSIRDLASRLNTDPATVLRIVRSLGFQSYRDFKAYLHELSIATATSLEGMQINLRHEDGLVSQGRRSLEQDLKNLHALRNTLSMERIVTLAKKLYSARKILIIAGDMAVGLAELLDYKLTLLQYPVLSVFTPGRTVHAVRAVNKQDLVIAISFQRGLRQTIEGLKQARANGAYCVGITNTAVSPIARFANEYLLTQVEAPFSSSYTAPLALINILLTVCANYRRARTLSILKKVDQEQRYGYRWYPD
jgi:DNA-binding MurR/RpiR family transcriptional regulator